MTIYFRQGDILFQKVDPSEIKGDEMKEREGKLIIAEGELTGHHHAISAQNQVQVFRNEMNEPQYLKVDAEPALLTHQEHLGILIPPGTWKIGREQEYNPFAKQLVRARD